MAAILSPSRGKVLERALRSPTVVTLPSFLVPAFQTVPTRQFSATTQRPSKLGRTPLAIPPGVEVTIGEPVIKKDATSYRQIAKRTVTVSGPLGTQDMTILPFITIDQDAVARTATMSIENKEIKQQREMWGTTWAYLSNYIRGVSEGHTAVLRLVGIGYRASIDTRPALETYPDQPFICLKLGFSHMVEVGVPKGMKASTPQPTRILLEGINKEELMTVAAEIRKWRRPEPYKGKGIFINDETIKLKQKKIK